ncbi:g9952 [Coccomyxa elongata]
MVKGKGHDKAVAPKGKGAVLAYKEQAEGWAAYYLDSCKVPLEKRQKQFQEKYSQFKEGNAGIVECRDWLYFAKFAFLVGLDSLCLPKCPSRSDLFDGSFPVEDCFECAMQAAHRGAQDGSIQSAVLFSHFADEFGLKGGILFIQHLTKGVDIEAWRDPKADWLKGDPQRMPFELATDPTVVGVTKEERVEIKLREIKGLLVAMMQCGRLKVPEEQKHYQAVDGDLSKVLLDARHVLFSLATKASRLPPPSAREMLVRTRDKVLLDKAAELTLEFWRNARPAADTDTSDDKFNAAKLRAVMDGRPGTKKGKAVKQLPAMKDMKDKLLTNQREAARKYLMDVVPEACSNRSAAPNPEELAFVRDLVEGRVKLQKDDIRKALADGKPAEEERKTVELWLESSAAEAAALECQHWEDKTLLTRPEMLNLVHHTALDRLRKQLLEDQDREHGTEDGLDVARTNLILELEQLVHGKPFEDMHVPNVSADLTIEDFINPPNSAESPDSLACLLPHAVHDVVSELANKLLRDQALDLLGALEDDLGGDSALQTHREALGDACNTLDGLVEVEAVGEKDANLRYYNLDEPLKEAQWVAGVVSQAFGRKLCVRAGDEKALAIRGQLLLEIHYMQMRRAVAQARGEFEYDRALAKRAYLIHKRLENESDEDLRRNLAGDGPPLPLHCVSRVTRMYREDDWLEDDAESTASGGDRRWSEQKADVEPPSTTGRADSARPASSAAAAADASALPQHSSAVNSFMADLYKKRGENARPSEALRAVEQQLANLYAEEVRERGRNSFLARTLEDVRDTLAAIEKGGDGSELTRDGQESIRVAGKLIENLEAQTQHNRKLVAAAAAAALDRDQLDELAAAASLRAFPGPPASAATAATAASQQQQGGTPALNGGAPGVAGVSANLDDIDYECETDVEAYLTSTDDESVSSLISEEDDASWKQRYLNLARDAADLLIESGFMSDALLRVIAIYIIACLKIQGEHTTLFHVTWRHMALLSQDQLYELANKLCVRLGNLQKVLPCYRSALSDYSVMEACISRDGEELLLVTASEPEDVMNDDDKFDAFRTVHDIHIPKQPRAQKPPKTNKETERWVKDFLDDTYREEGSAASRFANSKRVRELVVRAERLLVKAKATIEERHECLKSLDEVVHAYRDIVLVENQMRQQRQAVMEPKTFGDHLGAWQQTHEGVQATLLKARMKQERELLRSCEAGSKRARVNALPSDIETSCKAWAEKLVGISDDTSLTATDKAKIKEEYGLWEQKTGINAKEGGVGILGIRTRQLMHERRLELLEALRDKPSFFMEKIKAIAGAASVEVNKEVEEAFLVLLGQCQDIVKQDIRDVMQWLQRLDVRMEACRTEYHRTLQSAVEESLVDATEFMEKHAWEALRQTVAVKARNHAEAKKRAIERQEQLRKEEAAREAQERLLREEREREAARQEKARRKAARQQELAAQQAAKQQQQAEQAAKERAREAELAAQVAAAEEKELEQRRQQEQQRREQQERDAQKQKQQQQQAAATAKAKKQSQEQQQREAASDAAKARKSAKQEKPEIESHKVDVSDKEPDSEDKGAVLQRLVALTDKSAAEQDASSEAKRAAASNAASMSSASSQTGIEQSPRKRGAKAVEAAMQDTASGGWGDEEADNSTPDVRSWFTKPAAREADRGSDADRIPSSSLPKDPGKKVVPKERGPKCQCCKQNHKLVNCPKLTHLKVETRKKLTRMYEDGHTVDADNFMRKLGCLHCGELSHFLVACPELQFTTKDQRWELSDLYQGGNPKQAQKLVREWREAASAQAATTTGKPGVSAKPAPASPAVTTAKPPTPPQVVTAPADAKRAPAPPAASASTRAQSSAGPALAQIGAPLPQPQPNRRQQQLVAEDTRSSAPSESDSSALASQSGSFLDQMVPGMTRQDSTASSSQTGPPYGSLFPQPDQAAHHASSQPSDLPLYNLFPRPASQDISPRAPLLNKAPVLNTAPIFNPFPGMQSHQQASEQSSSGGMTAHPLAHDSLNALQSGPQPGASQAMQQSSSWTSQQNGAAPVAFGSSFPVQSPQASMGIFNAGASQQPVGYKPYAMSASAQPTSGLKPSASASAFGAASSRLGGASIPAASQQPLSSSRDPQLLRPPNRSASASVIGDRVVAPPQSHPSSGSSSLFSAFLGFGQRTASGQLSSEQILPKPVPKGGFGPIGSRPRAAPGQQPSQQISPTHMSQSDVGTSSMSSRGSEHNFQSDLAVNGRQTSQPSGAQNWPQMNGKPSGAQATSGPAPPSQQPAGPDSDRTLTIIVQALSYCTAFRDGLLRLDPRAVQLGSVVVGALAELFRAFAHEDGVSGGRPRPSAVACSRLRDALSRANPRIGDMRDTVEVLWEIFKALRAVRGGTELVDACFGQRVIEHVLCGSCGQKATHVSECTELIFTASATALQRHVRAMRGLGRSQPLGQVLAATTRQDTRACNTSEGGCGAPRPVQARLAHPPPRCFALQLAWQRPRVALEDIRDTLAALQEELDLADLYTGLPAGAAVYGLRAAVCGGSRAQALVRHSRTGAWLALDGVAAVAAAVGSSWPEARDKCVVGGVQPAMLLFEARFPAS